MSKAARPPAAIELALIGDFVGRSGRVPVRETSIGNVIEIRIESLP